MRTQAIVQQRPHLNGNSGLQKPLSIGKLSRLTGVGIETIRFYERAGLIAEPPRRESGYRQFPAEAVLRLHFIRRAKDLGFSLQEIKELLSLRIAPGATCEEVRERAEAKINDMEGKIRSLQQMAKALRKLVASCGGRGQVSDCPILAALENGPHNKFY